MNCYHCQSSQAKLKCADCDSEIFRFCSQQCGVSAHDEHKVLCYNRNSIQQVEDHLYAAIEEMQDAEEINDAMEVASELILAQESGDYDVRSVMEEAHEIIQGHIQNIGVELIGAQRTMQNTSAETKRQKKARYKAEAKRNAAKNKERALKDKEYNKKVNKINKRGRQFRREQRRKEIWEKQKDKAKAARKKVLEAFKSSSNTK